jgi:hypothetical protein
MAGKALSPNWRLKIQSARLIQCLEDHVFGKNDMKATQIKAAEILLKKTLPDLATVQSTGDADNPVNITYTWQTPS